MAIVDKKQLAETEGEFTYGFSDEFFITTNLGNFIWSDPEYGGKGTVRPTKKTLKEWLGDDLDFGRYKGTHVIGECIGTFELIA